MTIPAHPVPFHPDASHVSPDYRDGWNAALEASRAASVFYSPCLSHSRHSYSMQMTVACGSPLRSICPICEGMATNVRGPEWK